MAEKIASKKRSVGLVVLLKDVPGETKPVALLVRRGKKNPEKLKEGKINESFPGACQVTVHGHLEVSEVNNEDFLCALLREISEELGSRALNFIRNFIRNKNYASGGNLLVKFEQKETPTEFVVTFGCILPADFLNEIALGPASGGIDFLRREDLWKVQNLREYKKDEGVTDLRCIAMFPDEKESIELAFEKLVGPANLGIPIQCDACGKTMKRCSDVYICECGARRPVTEQS